MYVRSVTKFCVVYTCCALGSMGWKENEQQPSRVQLMTRMGLESAQAQHLFGVSIKGHAMETRTEVFTLNNHTRLLFARVLTCMSSASIPSSSLPLTLSESCPHLQVKCTIPDSRTPLEYCMEPLLFGIAMNS